MISHKRRKQTLFLCHKVVGNQQQIFTEGKIKHGHFSKKACFVTGGNK
jgi:hypothetical protein